MKPSLIKLSFFAVLLYLTACKKTAGSSNESESDDITGKWNVISDSTFEGVGASNHPVDYQGMAGDYFDFSSNASVYTKEGLAFDTLTYRMVSDTKIIISSFGLILNGVQDASTVSGLTAGGGTGGSAQIIVIESPLELTPGGEFWRKVTLSR
jgi:hypothetical protein